MPIIPYRPVVSEGDPNQPPSGCNITQSTGTFTENQPSAAERAAQGMARYNAYREQHAKLPYQQELAGIGRQKNQSRFKRMLRIDELK